MSSKEGLWDMKYRFECTFLDAQKVVLEITSEKTGKRYIRAEF